MPQFSPPAFPPRRTAAAVFLVAAVFCSVSGRGQEQRHDWTGTDVGRPGQPGRHTLDGRVLTVTGAAAGLNASGEDQLHFVSVPAQGDVEVVARLAGFDSGARAEVGLMLRPADEAPGGPVAGVVFSPEASGETPPRNVVEVRGRQPGNRYAPVVYGTPTPLAPPLWLKLVRVGGDFAAYRSTDPLPPPA